MTNDNYNVSLTTGDAADWPDPVKQGFAYLVMKADDCGFSIMGTIALNRETRTISVMFSPRASSNPHLYEMCEDLSEMFEKMAKRLKQ